MARYYLIIVAATLVATISQILLKKSADIHYDRKLKEYLNPYVIIGYGLLFVSMVLMIFANRGLDFKIVNAFEAISYVFMLVLGRIFLNEKITSEKLIGVTLIMIGVLVFCL